MVKNVATKSRNTDDCDNKKYDEWIQSEVLNALALLAWPRSGGKACIASPAKTQPLTVQVLAG